MTRFQAIDLSQLPTPDVVETLDYEAIRSALLGDLAARWPDFDMSAIEADPAVKVLEVAAYRELLLRARVNDAARAVLLPTATGADLDNLAANYHVKRFVVQEATETAAAVMESDASLRERVKLAIEAFACVGTDGAYRFHARSADPRVKDVNVYRPNDGTGEVDIAILAHEGDGSAPADLVNAVRAHVLQPDIRPLTDIITVRAAMIVPYSVAGVLKVALGPDPAVVKAEAAKAIQAYRDARHRVGETVYRNGLIAAGWVPGVEQFTLTSPEADVTVAADEAPWATSITVTAEAAG